MHFSSVFHKFSKYNNIKNNDENWGILSLALYADGHPLSGGFRYRIYVIFDFSGGVIFHPSRPTLDLVSLFVYPHLPPNRERVHVYI